MHRLLAPLFSVLSLLSADVAASPSAPTTEGLTPIEITLVGPKPVRLRVARGSTFPCDSGDNHLLVSGKFEPGRVIRLKTAGHCVCFHQTYAPFSDIDWGASTLICRPQICRPAGRSKRCVPAPDPTIRISIQSTRPSER
ncbi:MAG TPA: hypothetical protein VJV79_04180 [Polyangiaceae bacterium]|nr:hypothetical protein [Polyangiaceae bacterium]